MADPAPHTKTSSIPETAEVVFGPDTSAIPDGTVLYLDQLLLDESGTVLIDALAEGLVHLICPADTDVVGGAPVNHENAHLQVYSWDIGEVTVMSEAAVIFGFLDG